MWINVPSLADALLEAGLSILAMPAMPAGSELAAKAAKLAAKAAKAAKEDGRPGELAAILLFCCVASMHGARNEGEILDWLGRGRTPSQGKLWLKWLGIKSERKLKLRLESGVLARIDRLQAEQAVHEWTEAVLEYLQLAENNGNDEDDWIGKQDSGAGAGNPSLLESLSARFDAFLDRLAGPAMGRNRAPEFESLLIGLALTGYIESDVFYRMQAKTRFLKAGPLSLAGMSMAPISNRRWRQSLAA